MPTFRYKTQGKKGDIEESTIEAPDRFAVYRQVRKEGRTVVSVVQEGGVKDFKKWLDMERINAFIGRVKLSEVIMLTKNLSAMIEAGLVLSRAITIMEKQTKNAKLKVILQQINSDLKKGETFASALSKFPKVFTPLFVSMVRAGEESGSLAESLKVVGAQMDKAYLLKKKVRGAMMYPAIVIVAMIIISILMLMYVVPTLTATFADVGAELPASTKVIIALSDFLANNTIVFFALLVIFITLTAWGLKTPQGKRGFEWTILRLPIIGTLVREVNAARTSRTLSSLLVSGVEIVAALNITRDVVQNSYFKEIIEDAEGEIQKGAPISKAFLESEELYPVLFSEMIAVGEETGNLSKMLEDVAVFYEREVEQKTKDMSTIIEPILMLTIGGAVGFFAVSMITPIYSLSETI
jgi:type IV pilus assembly protein PilC